MVNGEAYLKTMTEGATAAPKRQTLAQRNATEKRPAKENAPAPVPRTPGSTTKRLVKKTAANPPMTPLTTPLNAAPQPSTVTKPGTRTVRVVRKVKRPSGLSAAPTPTPNRS